MRGILAVVTLGLGIGACTAVFSFVNPLLLHPFTYPRAGELVTIEERDPKGNATPVSLPSFRDWSTQHTAVSGMAAFDIGLFPLTGVEGHGQCGGALLTKAQFVRLVVARWARREFQAVCDRTET